MDRARVIAPSVSFAAHVGGASFLALGLLVLPERLPAPARAGFDTLAVSRSFAVSLGGGGALRGGPRRVVARPPSVVSPLLVPHVVPDAIPIDTLELASGGGWIDGIPDGVGVGDGDGVGLCLADCGGGGERGSAAVLPALEPRSGPVRARRGGIISEPRKVRNVAPEYPQLALAARVSGTVVLDCVIDEDGRVSSVTVLRSHPLLEAAAVSAVRQWRYVPTLLNGTPVSVLLTVTVDFRLR